MPSSTKISTLDQVIILEQLFAEGLKKATTLKYEIEGEEKIKASPKSLVRQMKGNRAVTRRNLKLNKAI